jgi:beta-galactosidase
MTSERRPVKCAAAILLAWLAPAACIGGVFDKVVVFPTADALRVQVTLKSDAAIPGVKLRAEIRPAGGGKILWAGTVGSSTDLSAGKPASIEDTVSGLHPRLWSPGSPALYEVKLTAAHEGVVMDTRTIRTGFRTIESREGQILLNGKPIFLCGLAINPPGRGVPEATGFDPTFARDYVRFLRSQHFNCIRMNLEFTADPRAQVWFDACDELGMLVYQGSYGSPPTAPGNMSGKTDPPADVDASVAAYRSVFETYARHPAIVIYILSNELPAGGKRGQAWHEFLTVACAKLKTWDATRLYIGNAGYGEGREGDLNDVHRYWGWYYNSFLTYYNLRKAQSVFGEPGAVQPITFSECVGTFTSTLGEVNLTYRKQMASQLEWTGHSGEQAKDALAYQAFIAGHACESFRTLREVNPRLSGLMPFTILFYNWEGLTRFDQMRAKPVVAAMGAAYQPVLLSWELWTPQVYAGTTIQPFAHIVNDSEDFADLTGAKLSYQLNRSGEKDVLTGEITIPTVPYFGHHKLALSIKLPADLVGGEYLFSGNIVRNGKTISHNTSPVFIASAEGRKLLATKESGPTAPLLYDPSGDTAKALATLGIRVQAVADLSTVPPGARLIIGERAGGTLDAKLAAFVREGGRVLLLAQDAEHFQTSWLPAGVEMLKPSANDPEYLHRQRPTRDGMRINIERPTHPVFAGLDRARLELWSDYTGWEQTRPNFPAVYPVTSGFRLTRSKDLEHVAVLANYDRGLDAVALCEMFDGKGSVIFTGFDLVRRAGLDPAADRMLANLVAYLSAGEHPVYPLVDGPIQWGRYPTERGLIVGPLNGLVVNCRWVRPPTAPDAKPLPDNEGAWNMLPGQQFVAMGQRAIGPFTYTSGATVVESDKKSPTGSGGFHAALPPGKGVMITLVENPTSSEAALKINVNGREQSLTIPPGKTLSARSQLDGAPSAVHVSYAGSKHLVILETRFE